MLLTSVVLILTSFFELSFSMMCSKWVSNPDIVSFSDECWRRELVPALAWNKEAPLWGEGGWLFWFFTMVCNFYLYLLKDAIMLVCTAVTVTLLVLQIVKTTRVTYKVEGVPCVNLDGLGYIVIQVRWQCACW